MFCRSEDFCPQLGVSNNTHGTVYTNNSPTGVLTTGGQTPQTSSLSGSIDSHKMIYITFGAELVGCISCHSHPMYANVPVYVINTDYTPKQASVWSERITLYPQGLYLSEVPLSKHVKVYMQLSGGNIFHWLMLHAPTK